VIDESAELSLIMPKVVSTLSKYNNTALIGFDFL